jgi:hypothetical protein
MQQHFEETSDVRVLFRQVNERVLEVNRDFGPTARLADFVCECADPECAQRLTLSVAQFDAVRTHEGRYVVQPDHVASSGERAVELHKGFAVVERLSDGGRLLAEPQTAA